MDIPQDLLEGVNFVFVSCIVTIVNHSDQTMKDAVLDTLEEIALDQSTSASGSEAKAAAIHLKTLLNS